jgi:hypothetical protein
MKYFYISVLVLILAFSCRFDRVYVNKKYRYKITYPKDWIALNSGHDRKAEEEFRHKLASESSIVNYNTADAAFFNPKSSGPIFEQIILKSEKNTLGTSNINENLTALKTLFYSELIKKFKNVEIKKGDVLNFKKGDLFWFEFSFQYINAGYTAYFLIIIDKTAPYYYMNGICRTENSARFINDLNDTLNTLSRY